MIAQTQADGVETRPRDWADSMRSLPAMLSTESLHRVRISWLIRSRWFFAAALGLLGVFVAFTEPDEAGTRLLLSALALSLANLLYAALEHHLPRRSRLRFEITATSQLLGDVLTLSLLAHFSGGLTSPFLLLLLAPAVVATMVLRSPLAPLVALFCLGLPLALQAATEAGALTRHPEPTALPLAGLIPLLTLCFGTGLGAFAVVRVVRRLREQSRRLEVRGQLLQKSQEQQKELRREIDQLADRSLVAELSAELARSIREPLGIVRARAEALSLSAADGMCGSTIQHDAGVLLRNLESVQRGLRGILAFLPAATVQEDVNVAEIARQECRRLGLDARRFRIAGLNRLERLRGSHDELELAVGLILRLVEEHSPANAQVRGVAREVGGEGALRVRLRFPIVASAPSGSSGRRGAEEAVQPITSLRVAVLRHVIEKHQGELLCELPLGGPGELAVTWHRPHGPQPAVAPHNRLSGVRVSPRR